MEIISESKVKLENSKLEDNDPIVEKDIDEKLMKLIKKLQNERVWIQLVLVLNIGPKNSIINLWIMKNGLRFIPTQVLT